MFCRVSLPFPFFYHQKKEGGEKKRGICLIATVRPLAVTLLRKGGKEGKSGTRDPSHGLV